MLTDDDKQYLNQRFDQTETRLKEYADQMETRLKEYTDQVETRLKEYTDQRAETIETRLLLAFRNFAHPVEARLRVSKALSNAVDVRIEALEDRVTAIEENQREDRA